MQWIPDIRKTAKLENTLICSERKCQNNFIKTAPSLPTTLAMTAQKEHS